MKLQTQIILSLALLWVVFLVIVYWGASEYLLASLLQIEGKGSQEVLINQYGFSETIRYYLMVFVGLGIIIFALAWYLLRGVFIKHANTVEMMQQKMVEESKVVEELHRKIAALEKRSVKSDQVDGIFHELCDHLNSLGTSLALLKEKVGQLQDERLGQEMSELERHFVEINRIIKSM